MKPADELRHLFAAPEPEDEIEGAGIILFNVHCPGNANEVLYNCREVLAHVLQQYEKNWLSENQWRELLPEWFVERCAPERTEEEEENLASGEHFLEKNEIREIEEPWSVMDWISSFEPSDDPFNQRYWFWWDAFVKEPNLLLVAVEVVDVPFPWGSLEWLMQASGAIKVEEAKEDRI